MRVQQGALDGVLRGKQQPHDYLPTLKSEIIDAGLLPNKRTHALLAEYSLQPGKVKEVRRRPPTHAPGGRSSAACLAHACARGAVLPCTIRQGWKERWGQPARPGTVCVCVCVGLLLSTSAWRARSAHGPLHAWHLCRAKVCWEWRCAQVRCITPHALHAVARSVQVPARTGVHCIRSEADCLQDACKGI